MSAEEKEQIDRLKAALSSAMMRVPFRVVNGDYKLALQYKSDYRKAEKILKKNTPKLNDLHWAMAAMT